VHLSLAGHVRCVVERNDTPPPEQRHSPIAYMIRHALRSGIPRLSGCPAAAKNRQGDLTNASGIGGMQDALPVPLVAAVSLPGSHDGSIQVKPDLLESAIRIT
jgi:hypothetical protein